MGNFNTWGKVIKHVVIFLLLGANLSCAASHVNKRYTRPKKKKMQPCNCSDFGFLNIKTQALYFHS